MEHSHDQSRSGLGPWIWTAWATALLASGASIYFIEILHKPAATICWVNRMLMFGLLLLLTVGLLRRDRGVWRYGVPFLGIGIPLAVYQQLVHWDIIHLAPQNCSLTYVCTTKFFNLFGFISQATLCLMAFTIIAVCLWRLARRGPA
jgi:disulfide bond formation protein DsbB